MEEFVIKSYLVSELALLYYPELTAQGAYRLFYKELRATRGLIDALEATGYHRYAKRFTRKQVRTIVRFLGEP